jgi:hypothetical protein
VARSGKARRLFRLDRALASFAEDGVVASIAAELEAFAYTLHVGMGADLVGDAVRRSLICEMEVQEHHEDG